MTSNFKKGISAALAAVMCSAAVSASAATWKPVNIDMENGGAIQYQEYDDQGLPTGRSAYGQQAQDDYNLPGFAKITVERTWFSDYYPNYEYQNLYAETAATGKVYSGTVQATGRSGLDYASEGKTLVEYRDVDYMWEAAAPHRIYSITQAKLTINGATQWYGSIEKNYPVQYTGRNAEVTAERIAYGFGDYKVSGSSVSVIPAALKAGYMDTTAYTAMVGVTASQLAPSYLAPAHVEVTASEVLIPRTYAVKLTGPAFDANGNEIKNGLVLYAAEDTDYAKYNISDIVGVVYDTAGNLTYCDITWTAGGYEADALHRVYEFLTVDGVVMDGSEIAPGVYKPYLFRYTGAYANVTHATRTVYSGVTNGQVMAMLQGSYDNGATWFDIAEFGTGMYPSTVSIAAIDTTLAEKFGEYVYVFVYDGQKYVVSTSSPRSVYGIINSEQHVEVAGEIEFSGYVH